MDQDISLMGATVRARNIDLPVDQTDIASEVKDSQKVNSQFGLNSDVQTIVQLGIGTQPS